MTLYDILACPNCKVAVVRQHEHLICSQCNRSYPIINDVPILLPDGSVPVTTYQHELNVRPGYDPWIHRVVMQSLQADACVLDIGAGNLTLDLPNVIRMDVTLTPYVDVVGDAHALPFLPEAFDFIFSLAVFEHLRQPFIAAQEIFAALRNGGYAYHECNFVFAYHGYPHHYFNASEQGLEQVFAAYEKLRSGVAPYQMPSFAIRMLLLTYLRDMQPSDAPDVQAVRSLLQNILDQPLGTYDALFSEDAALRSAAGVFYFGRKSTHARSSVIPQCVQAAWEQTPELQQRFPKLFDLGTTSNIMTWAAQEGRRQFPPIADYLQGLTAFKKREAPAAVDQPAFSELPLVEPRFGNIADTKRAEPVTQQILTLQQRVDFLEQTIGRKDQHIHHLESLIGQIESGRLMKLLRALKL
jgi:uncharacterized protein YbaR (Trm112 family)/SAM-dependent methyltransferase